MRVRGEQRGSRGYDENRASGKPRKRGQGNREQYVALTGKEFAQRATTV